MNTTYAALAATIALAAGTAIKTPKGNGSLTPKG